MTILELREKRNKAWEAAKAFVETKRDKDGLLSAEDAATYAEMEQKVQNYSAEIARMEEMEAIEAELNKPVNTPITGKPMNGERLLKRRLVVHPMNTVMPCFMQSVTISVTSEMCFLRGLIPMVVILYRKNMIPD